MTIYVGCSLTQAPPEFKRSVEWLKGSLRCAGYETLEFLGLTHGTERDVYQHDIRNCVGKCDFFLAVCDLPSIGLGYELGTAVEKHGLPTLAVAHVDSKVTRLVLGIDHPLFRFERYHEMAEVVEMVKRYAPLQ